MVLPLPVVEEGSAPCQSGLSACCHQLLTGRAEILFDEQVSACYLQTTLSGKIREDAFSLDSGQELTEASSVSGTHRRPCTSVVTWWHVCMPGCSYICLHRCSFDQGAHRVSFFFFFEILI